MLTRSGLLIGRVFGIPIYLDLSWFFLFVLLTITLRGQFAQEHTDWGSGQQWWVAVATSVLFFASVILHELGHSMVARRYKIPVVSITLFVFGGLARIGRDPSKAIQEFNIAIAGPIASLVLAAGFYGVTRLVPETATVNALATYLADTNLALALFNLLPGFPLDGG